MKKNSGILLTNIGSPEDLNIQAIRKYLKQFLSDKRVVEIPSIIWWPILHGIILQSRPRKTLSLYQKIWTAQGSPLSIISQKIANNLELKLGLPVAIGMHYGNPSIESALNFLQEQQVQKIIVLPLYPQYSATTTAATFDQIAKVLKTWRALPELIYINHYCADAKYIDTLVKRIQQTSFKHLIFSFHGIPERYIAKGDPYAKQCEMTVKLITDKLNLTPKEWTISFQSRLGKAKWLKPYTEQVFKDLPKKGIKDIHVICPGFAVDCLETLEEIAIRGKEQFLRAGGENFQYIPSLNDSTDHIDLLSNILNPKALVECR